MSVITVGTGENGVHCDLGIIILDGSADGLVSVNRDSSSWPALKEARAIAVNILSSDQSGVADRFAGRGVIKGNDRYVGWEWSRLGSGALRLNGAVSVIDCDLDEAIEMPLTRDPAGRCPHGGVFNRGDAAPVLARQLSPCV